MADELPVPDVPGDGVVDVPVDSTEEKKMAMEDTTKVVLEQSAIAHHTASQHAFRRLQDGQDNVAEQTRLQFITSQSLFAAKAAGNLNMDPLGKAILDQRSVKNRPNVT
mgnify:CR=1 FL=1